VSTDRNAQHTRNAALERLNRLARRHETAAIASALMIEAAEHAAMDAGATPEQIRQAKLSRPQDRRAAVDALAGSPDQDQLL